MGAQWIIDFTHAHTFHMIGWRAVIGVRDISRCNRKHREIGGKLLAGFGLGGHRRCPLLPTNQDRYIRLSRPRNGERIDQDVVSTGRFDTVKPDCLDQPPIASTGCYLGRHQHCPALIKARVPDPVGRGQWRGLRLDQRQICVIDGVGRVSLAHCRLNKKMLAGPKQRADDKQTRNDKLSQSVMCRSM